MTVEEAIAVHQLDVNRRLDSGGKHIELCMLAWNLAIMNHPEHRNVALRQTNLLRKLMPTCIRKETICGEDDLEFLNELMGELLKLARNPAIRIVGI